MKSLEEAAQALARMLSSGQTRIVLAESCTAGLAAAMLATVPGMSRWLCGSAVTYRERTKIDWLGVSPEQLARHTAVSAVVSEQMASGALARSVEADLAVAITGHLGPDAPADLDGVVFIAVARRRRRAVELEPATRHRLHSSDRAGRQREAAALLLRCAAASIQNQGG